MEEWVALLDGALPPHLRDQDVSPPLLTLAATDLAEILLAAQMSTRVHPKGLDLLYHLGFKQGRWSAVVWLIKKLVDRFPIPRLPDTGITDSLALWNQSPPFVPPLTGRSRHGGEDEDEDSSGLDGGQRKFAQRKFAGDVNPIYLELDTAYSGSKLSESETLDELTGSPGVEDAYQRHLAHDALGQIWRTLGAMTKACAGESIRQEVLEIIAYLHHREVMPMSIYQYQPRMDKSAIQQPPLIPLLSSRILTSLSDAAWSAHERLMIEEAKVRQGDRAVKGPPVLAAPYRARIDGLFPEVWLELILWSCLQGGWVEQGGYILDTIAGDRDWKPLSWREYEKALPPHGQSHNKDWDVWDYFFKTRAAGSMDPPTDPIPDVHRTVSAELVNAYIDAIASLPSDRFSHEKSDFRPVVKLICLKSLLAKEDLGLTTGSWDALALRMIENRGVEPEKMSHAICRIVGLSPGLDQGLLSSNTQDLPAYVLDGGLAMQGVLSRALHGTVRSGNIEPALLVFRDMIARVDRDKQTSLASFLEGSNALLRALDGSDMFTSNVTGIDYPAFDLQIPTPTLAMFLDLIIQSKAYEFGRWLLYSTDADGPVIKSNLYDDPFLTPALVRFAAATQDAKLFAALRKLPNFSVRFVLDAQINAMRWETATGIVQYNFEPKLRKFTRRLWELQNLASLARVMLFQIPGARAGSAESRENLQGAMKLFSDMVIQVDSTSQGFTVRVQTLLTVLSSVDITWAKFCFELRVLNGHHDFLLRAPEFNSLLGGVVTAYGGKAGRRLLKTFWPQSARRSQETSTLVRDETRGAQPPRIVVSLPDMSPEHSAVVYGALKPNFTTIDIILQEALKEGQGQGVEPSSQAAAGVHCDDIQAGISDTLVDLTPRGMVAWAARRMAELPDYSGNRDVVLNIDGVLRRLGREDLRKDLVDIVRGATADLQNEPNGDLDDVTESGGNDPSSDGSDNMNGTDAFVYRPLV